jgi:hypothetical protein
MHRTTAYIGILFTAVMLSGCSGGGSGPGYLFQIIFIVLPMVGLGLLLLKRSESTNDSLYILEGQLKRLSAKLDSLEEKVSGLTQKGTKPRAKK